MILDTSFLVDVLRGEEAVATVVDDLDEHGTPRVSAITTMELWEGIHLADATDEERDRVEELLAGLHEVPFDRACAMKAGELSASLTTAGEPIEDADVMIAATALVHDEAVLTRNVEHFERVEGLDIAEY